MPDSVLFEISDGIGTITLNTPSSENALSREMSEGLAALAHTLPTCDDLRVLLICGAGESFMAGEDVASFEGAGDAPAAMQYMVERLSAFVQSLQSDRFVVVAAVQGRAAGSGFSLAIASDITIAADDAVLIPGFRKLATCPFAGATHFLPRLVGTKKASEILLAGSAITAEEARKLNLVNSVVPRPVLNSQARTLCRTISLNSRTASCATKMLLKRGLDHTLDGQVRDEMKQFKSCVASSDFSEGIEAFLQRRAPQFDC
jgi:2-(1,2-epoxy-1,2-dihydrophenyl)acetyl-CoA isomerase